MAKKERTRVNAQIRVPSVRLIDHEGEQRGIVPIDEARRVASEAGLDLVEVAAATDPPVCRVMDYGKYKYQQAKKLQEGKKKQAQTQVKEVKLRPKIDEHDFQTKMRKAREFLEGRNRVKVTVQFRGREIAYTQNGYTLLEKVIETLDEVGAVDARPKMEGRQMSMIVSPK